VQLQKKSATQSAGSWAWIWVDWGQEVKTPQGEYLQEWAFPVVFFVISARARGDLPRSEVRETDSELTFVSFSFKRNGFASFATKRRKMTCLNRFILFYLPLTGNKATDFIIGRL
jgi:hypothetical protein